MAKQTINIGAAPNDGTGDSLRDAFDKVNDNTDELYAGMAEKADATALDAVNTAVAALDTGSTSGLLTKDDTTGIGYAGGGGAGGTVVQSSSKNTAVTLNALTGKIQMASSALVAGATAIFKFNNNKMGPTDIVIVQLSANYSNIYTYQLQAEGVGAGSCWVSLTNVSAGSLSESVTFRFVVIKGADT